MGANEDKLIVKQISQKIRKQREDLGLTRSYLASEIGLDEKQLRRIENGESSLPIVTLLKICFVLKIDIEFLNEYLIDDSILF